MNYQKRCNVIYNLVKYKYCEIECHLILNKYNSLYEMHLPIQSAIVTILHDSNIENIYRHMDKKINGKWIGQECNICCEEIKRNITCSKCSNNWCGNCYINMFKTGEGITKCPYCCYQLGEKMSPIMVELGIYEIMCKLGINEN